jgi:predicted Zn-dependent peptidase
VARSVAQLALHDLPDSYFEDFVPRVHAIGPADVVDVAARYVDPAQAVTLIVGDYKAIEVSLSELRLGEPEILPADQ